MTPEQTMAAVTGRRGGMTLLHLACKKGNSIVIKKLVLAGAFLEAKSFETSGIGRTPLESVPKRWTEQHMVVDDDDGSDPMALPLTIKVVVADPGNSRVQILEHRVHFSSKLSSVIEKKSGCCVVS